MKTGMWTNINQKNLLGWWIDSTMQMVWVLPPKKGIWYTVYPYTKSNGQSMSTLTCDFGAFLIFGHTYAQCVHTYQQWGYMEMWLAQQKWRWHPSTIDPLAALTLKNICPFFLRNMLLKTGKQSWLWSEGKGKFQESPEVKINDFVCRKWTRLTNTQES